MQPTPCARHGEHPLINASQELGGQPATQDTGSTRHTVARQWRTADNRYEPMIGMRNGRSPTCFGAAARETNPQGTRRRTGDETATDAPPYRRRSTHAHRTTATRDSTVLAPPHRRRSTHRRFGFDVLVWWWWACQDNWTWI